MPADLFALGGYVGVCKRMFRSLDDLASTNHVSPYSTLTGLGIYLIALIEAYIGVDGGANHVRGKYSL
jgi:hypothetical protein